MRSGSVRALESHAERLWGDQQEVRVERTAVERRANDIAQYHGELMDRLRSLPSDTDPWVRARLEERIAQERADWQEEQAHLAQLEERQAALDREIASVTGDAREYLQSVDGNIEAARGAAGASPYGSAAIARLVSGFQSNRAAAERVLSLLGQSGGGGGLGGGLGLGSGAAGAPKATIQWGQGPEGVLHMGDQLTRPLDPLPATREGRRVYRDPVTQELRSCYDDPVGTGSRLNHRQGQAVPGFLGTCGLVSVEDVARLGGKDATEADMIMMALNNGIVMKIDPINNPAATGGTSPFGRQKLLGLLGIDSYLDTNLDPEHIGWAVDSGRGVIATVDTARFWPDATSSSEHAVTLTSTARNEDGELTGFFVCDSGHGDAARVVSVDLLASSLVSYEPLNVTSDPIR